MNFHSLLDATVRPQNPEAPDRPVSLTKDASVALGYRLAEIRPRRKLQEKRILWLLAAGAVAAAAVHLVHELQVKLNAGAFLRQAELAQQQGNRQQAAIYLSGYLGYKPEDAAILTRYAILLDELATAPKSRRRAVLALEQALRREPRNEDLRRRAATAE